MKKDFPLAISSAILRKFSPKINDDRQTSFERNSAVQQIVFVSQENIKITFFNGSTQILTIGSNEAQEYIGLRNLVREFFRESDGFDEVVSIRYITGVRIQFANEDVVHMRYSKNKPTEFRVYTNANSQERSDSITHHIVIKKECIYDKMRADFQFLS